jgi:hypothetical protein
MEYQEFKNILKKNRITVKKFSELANTSYNTCNTWSRNNKVPNWVFSWLDLYIKNQKLENERIDDKEYQELLELRKAFQVLLSKGKVIE